MRINFCNNPSRDIVVVFFPALQFLLNCLFFEISRAHLAELTSQLGQCCRVKPCAPLKVVLVWEGQ